eukprot:7719388-Pyramimonas_sp.AAC.1
MVASTMATSPGVDGMGDGVDVMDTCIDVTGSSVDVTPPPRWSQQEAAEDGGEHDGDEPAVESSRRAP